MRITKIKKRGVSVVISAMLILAITTIGAVLVSQLIQTSSITSISQTSKSNVFANSLTLTSYDTRDAATLSAIPTINNKFDNELCTDRCKDFSDNIPTSPLGEGTDFIVIQIRNKDVREISIHGVQVNGILHTWDSQTAGVFFDASANVSNGEYPLAGKFSIISTSNDSPITQRTSLNMYGDEEVRLIIKLSESIQPDISLGDSLQLLVNLGSNQPVEYIIPTGDTK